MTAAAAVAKSLQSCLTLCDPIDGSPIGLGSVNYKVTIIYPLTPASVLLLSPNSC